MVEVMTFEKGLEKIEKDRIFEHKHNCKIKERLKKYRDDLNPRPTYKTLMAELEKNFNSELKVSYATLHDVFERKTIDGDGKVEPAPNLNIVLALCYYWGISCASILAPYDENTVLPQRSAKYSDAVYLADEGYQGIFWGYMCSRTLSSRGIATFKLSINKESAGLDVFDSASDGSVNESPTLYRGIPILLKRAQKVYIVFSNVTINQPDEIDGSRFYIFCFDYLHFNKNFKHGGLYYRRGVVITEEAQEHNMLVENFVLFKKRIDISSTDKQNVIRGLLSFTDDGLYIKQQNLDRLSKSEKIGRFIQKYEYNWKAQPFNGYYLSIEQILAAIKEDTFENLYGSIDALLQIISNAEASTRHFYKVPDKLRLFAKEELQDLL